MSTGAEILRQLAAQHVDVNAVLWLEDDRPIRLSDLLLRDAARLELEDAAPPMLTTAEHTVVAGAGRLWGAICAAIPEGPTRSADLAELIVHVHAIQHAVMANAAARAYPEQYRRLGSTLTEKGATS